MSRTKGDLVNYRIQRAYDTLDAAKTLAESGHWNGVANRLYYACFYAVLALMTQTNIRIKSHSGAEAMFELHFIKAGKVEPSWGKLYTRLSGARHESDYAAFSTFEEDDILPLLPQTKEFIGV